MINQLVNQRYEILEKVGESALFVVYKARDKVANRVVALKVVTPGFASDPAYVEGLTAGLRAATNLNHPNITHIQEIGEDGNSLYMVTDFVRGLNLKERIRRTAPFTLSVAVDYACSLAEALHYSHTMGQTHGDLRPQNVVISPEGALMLTDFGVQRGILRSAKAQKEVLLRGAPYHAPELSTTQPGTVAGDVYALGAVLYEMLTGTPLYSGDTPEAIADQHAFATIPSPRNGNPGVPRSVEGIVLKCLQKRPEQRYRNAAELVNDLKSVRDALRFGKSLSWSPIDVEKMPAPPERPNTTVASTSRALEPVAEVVASSQVIPMPAKNNTLRRQDERVSIYIRGAIVAVTMIIVVCLIAIAGIWSSQWVVPKPLMVPVILGRPIDEVKQTAEKMNVRLIEHAEFSERPKNIIYKADREEGTQIRPNQVINVWYSKGSTFVNVPKVVGLARDEAEKKLKEAGLVVGNVTTENSDTVPFNIVIRQADKKRVLHDASIDFVLSDGPKSDFASPQPNAPNPDAPGENDNNTGNNARSPGTGASTPENEIHNFERSISVGKDGRGMRQVRVEYQDSLGVHTPVDEPHNEGDKIPVAFSYYGKQITLTIYYDNVKVRSFNFDPQSTRNRRME